MTRLVVVLAVSALAACSVSAEGPKGAAVSVALPNPALVGCRSPNCSTLWYGADPGDNAAYPRQVTLDVEGGAVSGIVAVYDASVVSLQGISTALDDLYAPWAWEKNDGPVKLWRVEPERLAVQLTTGEGGTTRLVYLAFRERGKSP
jgi:hypothetical protein